MNRRLKINLLRLVMIFIGLCCWMNISLPIANCQGETVRVAVTDYPYFIQQHSDGSVSGYAYEYLMKIARYTGWDYQFIEMSFADAANALTNGEIDIIAGNQITPGRMEVWDFSDKSMGDGTTVLCVRKDSKKYSYNDYQSYDGMKIAVMQGSVRKVQSERKLSQYGVKADYAEYATDKLAKAALMRGDVDAVLMSTIRCDDDSMILARIQTADLYFSTNKQRPELKQEIDAAIEKIHLEHPYFEENLSMKYYGDVLKQTALTDEEQKFIASHSVINVAVSDDMEPVEYYDEQAGEYKGITVDVLNWISEYTGLTFNYVKRLPYDKEKQAEREGTVQIIGSVADLPRVIENMNVMLTAPIYSNANSFVTKNEKYLELGSKVALKEGYPFFEKIAHDMGYTNIIYFDSFRECIDAVNNDEADLMLLPAYSAGVYLHHAYYDSLKVYSIPSTYAQYGIGILQTPNSSEGQLLYSIINKAVINMPDNVMAQITAENLVNAMPKRNWRDYIAENKNELLMAVCIALVIIAFVGVLYARKSKRQSELIEAASKEKAEFFARVSHDMRTPMNGILGMANLSKDEKDVAVLQQNMGKILDSGRYMLGLINDTLDLRRIETGKLKLKSELIDGKAFFDSLNKMIEETACQQNISYTFIKHDERLYGALLGDSVYLKQIFVNLLTNAIKFTMSGGKISFEVEVLKEIDDCYSMKFTVSDNGVGMSEAFIKKGIFEPFSQEINAVTEQCAGTGLGLSIVKKLVDLMAGRIEVSSKPGHGTVFEVYIDIKKAGEQSRARIQMQQKNEQASVSKLLQGKRILVCEDQALNAEITKRMLEKAGCLVELAENGQIGLTAFNEKTTGFFSAVLMDIRMPIMGGLEAARRIRQSDRPDSEQIPIIALSANAFAEDVEKSLSVGMNEHLAKPVKPQILYRVLAEKIAEAELKSRE